MHRYLWVTVFVLNPLLTLCWLPTSASEPGGGVLRIGHWLEPDQGPEILLVQGLESTSSEAIQPADASGVSSRSLSSTTGSLDLGAKLDLFESQKPDIATLKTTSLNTPAEVEAVERVTGPLETGVVETAPLSLVSASTFSLVNNPDVAEAIIETSSAPSVRARRRSPISLEPRIRGYVNGQIYTLFDGAYIGPVRNDLDGVLSKVDQSLIASAQVISGPYGLRYGSGFSFLNIDSAPTPRYEDGREHHLRLGTHVRTNGGQTYNTATLLGGGEKGGYYANVGYRKGSDYEAGDGLDIPSSYEAFNLFSAIGRDIDDATRWETKFSFMDQGETEYAAQFFDVDALNHYGISHSIIHRDEMTGFGYQIDGWYSETQFDGDTDHVGKRKADFPVLQRVDTALAATTATPLDDDAEFYGNVDGSIRLAGVRGGFKQEYDETTSIAAGADFRYVRQRIVEGYDLSQFDIPDPTFDTGLPVAEIFDPGLYTEFSYGVTRRWNIAGGSRIAFASTQADGSTLSERSNFKDPATGEVNQDLSVSDMLLSFYLTNDYELNSVWQTRFGFGYAERLPDLTDRYSDGLFLATIQSGFSRVIGTPDLKKERNWQIDARLDGEYENVRGRFSAFHAWIHDYITYAANPVTDPLGARLLKTLNTDYATLAGFEGYGEVDLLTGFQAFGSLAYLDGRDREIHQPLSGISPLEARLGVRLTDSGPENAYGLEWGWRIVDNQDRLGTLRPVPASGSTVPIPLETDTPGFATSYLRGYLRPRDHVNITAGIENLFDRNYYEHLNLRLPADPANDFAQTIVLSPGITPYIGVEVEY
ncbi:vitamin B12/cobalamin outer membrane transporter [Novipirellula artificiosorum]|uniref:Vitamin B12/cobalamin outer membrane transporter n=2 Tax=Novipirellula artificiosorum TaxID=2528016 RepID=A0A5C6CCY8_9BACT|nr:vitamin B12/cobalamin outer membrane transporter [Novipirellula artificiosorum]